jgi:hypothetical protein
VATAAENRLTDHQASGAMDLLTSAQRGAVSAVRFSWIRAPDTRPKYFIVT